MRAMGLQRGSPWQGGAHHHAGYLRPVPSGPRQPAIQCQPSQRAVGVGLHLRLHLAGWLYVAFVVDVYARRIVGWRVSSSMQTDFVLDAWSRLLYERQPAARCLDAPFRQGQSVRPSATPSAWTRRALRPSVGSRGDSYDNALAETINGLYKAELIHRRGPMEDQGIRGTGHPAMGALVQSRPTAHADWGIPPAEAEANYWRQLAASDTLDKGVNLNQPASSIPGAVQPREPALLACRPWQLAEEVWVEAAIGLLQRRMNCLRAFIEVARTQNWMRPLLRPHIQLAVHRSNSSCCRSHPSAHRSALRKSKCPKRPSYRGSVHRLGRGAQRRIDRSPPPGVAASSPNKVC